MKGRSNGGTSGGINGYTSGGTNQQGHQRGHQQRGHQRGHQQRGHKRENMLPTATPLPQSFRAQYNAIDFTKSKSGPHTQHQILPGATFGGPRNDKEARALVTEIGPNMMAMLGTATPTTTVQKLLLLQPPT